MNWRNNMEIHKTTSLATINALNELVVNYIETKEGEQEILSALDDVITMMLESVESFSNSFENIVSIFEPTLISHISIITKALLDQYYNEILRQIATSSKFNYPAVIQCKETAMRVFSTSLEQLKDNEPVYMESCYISLDGFTNTELELYLDFVCKLVQETGYQDKTSEDIDTFAKILMVARNAAERCNRRDFYAHIVQIYVNSLSISHHNQHARNLSTGFLYKTYEYDLLEFGNMVCFSCFTRQSNLIRAGLHGLLFAKALAKKQCVDLSLIQDFAKYFMIFLREAKIHKLVEQVYLSIPTELGLAEYELRSIELVRVVSLIKSYSPKTVDTVLGIMTKHIDEIIRSGDSECYPWIIQISNITTLFQSTISQEQGELLNKYVKNMNEALSNNAKELIRKHFDSSIDELKDSYIAELKQTTTAINRDNFVYDVIHLNVLANNLLTNSVKSSDVEAYLLALLMKSDYSLVLKDKCIGKSTPIIITTNEVDPFIEAIKNSDQLLDRITSNQKSTLLCLCACNEDIYALTYDNSKETVIEIVGFSISMLRQWYRKHYPKVVYNIVEPIVAFGINTYTLCKEQEANIIEQLEFASVFQTPINDLLLVKDVNLSILPHNLLLNRYQEFISLKQPVTNIMSLEWYSANCIDKEIISLKPTIGMWIPTESQDMTINLLFSKLEPFFNDYDVSVNTKVDNIEPLSCNINILVAHGDADTCVTARVFASDAFDLVSLLSISGKGDLSILLICHSGHTKHSLYGHQAHSLVRHFLKNGYSSVIAPFWSLHVDMVPIWLSAFIESVEQGNSISNSLLSATISVHREYPTPSAWACLHLYGNPKLRYLV